MIVVLSDEQGEPSMTPPPAPPPPKPPFKRIVVFGDLSGR
jgi:hypothetical protein